MLIIIDKKIPAEAKKNLRSNFSDSIFLELGTEGLVYPAISGHPDIFFHKMDDMLICAPNLPPEIKEFVRKAGVKLTEGTNPAGPAENHTACIRYNAAAGEHHLVHRLEYTDPVILEYGHYLRKVAVRQGYTRCNLLFLKDDKYITSDQGIHKALAEHGLQGILVSPEGIILPGFRYGFIGGCAGICGNKVFISGSLNQFAYGEAVRTFLVFCGYEIIELYDGPLFDGGGIIFA